MIYLYIGKGKGRKSGKALAGDSLVEKVSTLQGCVVVMFRHRSFI